MPLTRVSVIEDASDNPNEVLVVFRTDDGQLQNELLRTSPDLRASLIAAPLVIPNPGRAPLNDQAFAAAEAQIAARENTPMDEQVAS